MNIILNAIQANPKTCLINVHTSTDGTNINIKISDNGPGIPKENINDIFTPFYTTKPVGEGTGLGLFVCYKIITEEHSGIISVDSTNKRTTFKITLPLPKINHRLLV